MSRKPAAAELGLDVPVNKLTGRFSELLKEIEQIGPAAAERRYGVNRGLLAYMLRTKKEPVDVEIRRKLGLPVLVLAAPCPQCGRVHRRSHPKPRRGRRSVRCYPLVDVAL